MAPSVQHYFRISGITMGWTELLVGAFTALFICTGLIVRYLYETKNIVSTIPLSEHYFRISGIPARWTEVDVVDGLKSLERGRRLGDQHPRLSLYPACSGSTQTGLLKLENCVEMLETIKLDKIQLELSVEEETGLVDMDGRFYNLTPLNTPENEHIVDVIAVSDLGAHAFESWISHNTGKMWLKDFLPDDVKGIRIMSYGYSSNEYDETVDMDFLDLRRNFLQTLANARRSTPERPLIFIGHGMGGILILQALLQSRQQGRNNSVFNSTRAIFFFGVPHQGQNVEHFLKDTQESRGGLSYRTRISKQLDEFSNFLSTQREDITHLLGSASDIEIITFYETMPVPSLGKKLFSRWFHGGDQINIVKRNSAQLYLEKEHRIPVSKNHQEMVKFSLRVDQTYETVITHMLRCVNKIAEKQILRDARANDAQTRDNEKVLQLLDDLFNEKVDSRHVDIKGKRTEGTGKWLLESTQFNEWMRGDSRSALLWAHGIAGAGKTYLSSIVIDHLSKYHSEDCNNSVGVAYIYFSYKEQGSQGPSNILGSLIKQLYQQLPQPPQLPPHLKNLTSDRRTASKEDFFSALAEASTSFSRIFLVFDALDECDRETQRETLLPMLHRMRKNGFRIFMTSRRYADDIEDSFRNAPRIEIIAHDDDIKSYIYERIDAYPSAKRMIQASRLEDEIISRFVRAAGGMFLFVSLNIRFLCEQPTGKHILTELERLQPGKTTDKQPMDTTYDRMLEAVRNQPEACKTLAIRTLAWLVKAQRILTIKELRTAVSLEADMTKLDNVDMPDEEKLIDFCFGLVVMDDITKVVRLAHFTTQEYLNRKNIIPHDSDTTLAIACTTYLSFDEFKKHDCALDKNCNTRRNTHHFFQYVVANLSFHINSSDQDSTVEVFGRFLEDEDNIWSYLNAYHRLFGKVLMPAQPLRLLVASALGHAVIVGQLLKNGCDSSTADHDLVTSLHLASYNGHLKVVKLLLENGANPNAVDKQKNTPLHIAVNNESAGIVRLLLDNGADTTLADGDMSTPLHCAARLGHSDVVKLLLENGANPNAIDGWMSTPLQISLRWKHLNLGKLLLENGANPNAVDGQKNTLLHKAVNNNHTEIVRLLLDNGADTTLADGDMSTPLHIAVWLRHLDIVKLLLEKGANPNAFHKLKRTPLHMAVNNEHTGIVRLLLDNGADTTLADNHMSTPLHGAARFGHSNVVKLLLENGANPNAVDEWKDTPLHLAAILGYTEVVRLLLNSGADVTLANDDMSTPLHGAVRFRYLNVVKLLLEHGADPNAADEWMDTPLSRAAGNRQVMSLLENGAN